VTTDRRRVGRIRAHLLRWYDTNRRDLPWRRTRDPYAIWISETMLQQTRVETVIPYYERFLGRFPDVDALADASEEEVFSLWAGLGYYSRARNLHRAAKQVAQEHGGELPRAADALQRLPGIGRYTAGALASIAFDLPEPIVDGNVIRVLTRLHGIREDVSHKSVVAQLWEEAERLAAGKRPGDLNQALMELGALLCTPRSPHCLACPLARSCDARKQGDAAQLPVKARKAPPRPLEATCARIERRGRVLVTRRPDRGLMAGMWELAGGELLTDGRETPEAGICRALREHTGLIAKNIEPVGEISHVFTHRKLRLHVFRCDAEPGRVRLNGPQAHRWVTPAELTPLALGKAARKALELLEPGAAG